MRFSFVAIMLSCWLSSEALGGPQTFPYQAVVQSEESTVYSGNGSRYYATGTLKRDDRVTVHRHDPGGWYMIAPPDGSFSWVPADAVQRQGDRRGVITGSKVAVRVGSSIEDPSRFVMHRHLSSGDTVEILGETTIRTQDSPVRMYRIQPPPGEYRWIRGQTVAPLDQVQSLKKKRESATGEADQQYSPPADSGPALAQQPVREKPSQAPEPRSNPKRKPKQSAGRGASTKSSPAPTDGPAVLPTGPDVERLQRDRRRLMTIDAKFRRMLKKPPSEWTLDRIEREYRQLRKSAAHPALANRVAMRLATLNRYRGIQQEYGAFRQVVAETNRREERLQALQQRHMRQLRPAGAAAPRQSRPRQPQPGRRSAEPPPATARWRPSGHSVSARREASRKEPSNGPRRPEPAPNRSGGRVPRARRPLRSMAHARPSSPLRPNSPTGMRRLDANGRTERRPTSPARLFDAAGIVQRAAETRPEAPSHVLVAPNGRVLAYLKETPEVDLDRYLGRSMGVDGARSYHRRLRSHVIAVRKLTPVRLAR